MGNNMFAYCLNNPVNLVDKNGETADSWAGWIGEQLTEWLYELFTGETHPNKQTRELENQIITQQNEMLADTTNMVWNAYMHSVELQSQSQYQQAIAVCDFVQDRFSTPEKAAETLDVIAADFGVISAYSGCVALGWSVPTFGMSVPTAGTVAVVTGLIAAGLSWLSSRIALLD